MDAAEKEQPSKDVETPLEGATDRDDSTVGESAGM